MSDLRELYQEVILDHSRKPRNHRELPGANRKADGFNPLCGDKATVYLTVEDGVVKDASFVGKGCSISTASASMMTESVKGKRLAEAEDLFRRFHDLITAAPDRARGDADPALGKLAVFSGVCEFPVRVKCATLPWHTLKAALEGEGQPVSTEE
jgi:nitrogen fixation NifU-like protein